VRLEDAGNPKEGLEMKNSHMNTNITMNTMARRTPAAGNKSTETNTVKSARAKGQPSSDEIAKRAYHYYVQRGCVHGHDREDWLRAERELTGKTR
jgi:hypothetical protein